MSDPVVSGVLAAVAAAAAVGTMGTAMARRASIARPGRSWRRLWWVPILSVGLVRPGPLTATSVAAAAAIEGGRRLIRARSIAVRRRAADQEVPQLLDLLAAASSAGLSAVAGFRAAVDTLRGPLGEELRACLDAVDLGGRWRPELALVTDRLDLPELRRALAILDRTTTLGTSLADATRELAADVRHARRAATAERARSAPVKMLFPLVFLILPAFLLLTVVPVLLTTVRSIG